MSDKDLQDTQAKLLRDIEAFANSKLDLSSVDPVERSREKSDFPTIDPDAAAARAALAEKSGTPLAADTVSPKSATPGGSLLERLKQEAHAKQMTDSQIFTLRAQRAQMLTGAMQAAFDYLNDLCNQINVLKPAIPVAYNLINLVDMDGLIWQEGRTDYRLKPTASDERLIEQVTLRFRLAAPKELKIERDNPAHEVFRNALFERNITFREEEVRNDRRHVVRTTFYFPCEIKAGLAFGANYSTGELRLQIRNIQRFGALEYQLEPEALTPDALEELAHFILGEQKRLEKLFRRIA